MPTKYRRVSYEQRCQITAYLETKISIIEISRKLGLHRSTIYREIKRNSRSKFYQAAAADDFATSRRKTFCVRRKRLADENILRMVRKKLIAHLSPEQISGRLKIVSHQTIYNALRADHTDLQVYLRRFGKRRGRGRPGRRQKLKKPVWFKSINDRPQEVKERSNVGHWERDTMLLKDRKMMLICVERKSRFIRIEKLNKHQVKKVNEQSLKMMSVANQKPLSITNDNGSEFYGHHEITIPIYFCNPYSPHERGSVENIIGLVRQYFKRSTDLNRVTKKQIKEIENKLNHRPRKCLNFKTPYEVLFEKDVALAV